MLTKAERKLVLGTAAALALYIDNDCVGRGWSSSLSKDDREFLLRTAEADPKQAVPLRLIDLIRDVLEQKA